MRVVQADGRLLAAAPSAAAPTNLVPNGDVEAGDTGFSSDYQSAAPNTAEGQYTIGANPQAWNGSLIVMNSNLAAQGNDFAIDDVFLGTETSVAEPTSLALLGLGLAALARSRRRARA